MSGPPLFLLAEAKLRPSVVARDVAQSQHRINILSRPTPSCLLQSAFNNELVGALDAAASYRVSQTLELIVVDHLATLFQVVHASADYLEFQSTPAPSGFVL